VSSVSFPSCIQTALVPGFGSSFRLYISIAAMMFFCWAGYLFSRRYLWSSSTRWEISIFTSGTAGRIALRSKFGMGSLFRINLICSTRLWNDPILFSGGEWGCDSVLVSLRAECEDVAMVETDWRGGMKVTRRYEGGKGRSDVRKSVILSPNLHQETHGPIHKWKSTPSNFKLEQIREEC